MREGIAEIWVDSGVRGDRLSEVVLHEVLHCHQDWSSLARRLPRPRRMRSGSVGHPRSARSGPFVYNALAIQCVHNVSIPPDATPMSILTKEQAMERLGVSPAVLVALLNSGLLGFWDHDGIPAVGVDHFKRFGTQWREELGTRQFPMESIPVPADVGEEQPPSTVTQLQFAVAQDQFKLADSDGSWIAQYYFRPNPFFFPSPLDSGLVGPIPILLPEPAQVQGMPFVTTLYPDPPGRLAMIMVSGPSIDGEDAFGRAYDSVIPLIAELSFRSGAPLPVAHSIVVGVPSGTISIEIPKPSRDVSFLSLDLRNPLEHDGLLEAKALFLEASNSLSPFHQFLCYWKVYEYVTAARKEWGRKHKRSDVRVRSERLPEVWVWRKRKGLPFQVVLNGMREDYRNAIAHADPRCPMRSVAYSKDLGSVATAVPVLRYIARTVLENFEATLDQPLPAAATAPADEEVLDS